MFKLNKKLIPLSAILIACLIPSVFAQSVSRKPVPQNKVQLQVVRDQPWLVTVVHQINLSELEKSLLQRGIKMNISGDRLINFTPINVTTGIVIDKEGHILTRLVNLNPEAGEKGVGSITILLPSGEERQARFIGLDGPSGFCLLTVEDLSIEPAPLATQLPVDFNVPVTVLNVEFNDKSNPKQRAEKLDRVRQLSRNLLSQSTKVVQLFNRAFFTVSFTNGFSRGSSVSFGVVMNKNSEVIGIPENFQNNAIKVFSVSEARRAATRVINQQGNVPRGWLGIGGFDTNKLDTNKLTELKLAQPSGVYINSVIPSSPAEVFGLRENDVILTLNNEPLESEAQLSSFLELQPAGETLDIGVWRNSQLRNYSVVLGARGYNSPFVQDKIEEQSNMYFMEQELKSVETALDGFRKEFYKKREQVENPSIDKPVLKDALDNIKALERERYLLMARLKRFTHNQADPNLTEKFLGVKVEDLPDPPPNPDVTKPQRFPHGVRVLEVIPNSLAERSGVKVGDILVQITTLAIDNKDNLNTVLNLVRSSAALAQNTILVTRNDQKLILSMPLPRKLPKVNLMGEGEILTEEKFKLLYSNTFAEEPKPQN